MLRQKAVDYFSGKEGTRLNCAQSIVAADPKKSFLTDSFAKYGGGRAPEGWCGPAYVALRFLEKRELIETEFTERAGSVKCEEIRKNGRLSCIDCVELGAELIEENRKLK